jgi:hypothetical protein
MHARSNTRRCRSLTALNNPSTRPPSDRGYGDNAVCFYLVSAAFSRPGANSHCLDSTLTVPDLLPFDVMAMVQGQMTL